MTWAAWLGALSWGAFTATLFVGHLQRAARRLAVRQRREPLGRLFRPMLVSGILFAPALIDRPLVVASLAGFAVVRSALLARAVRWKHAGGGTP